MGCGTSKKSKKTIHDITEVVLSRGLFIKVNSRPFSSVYKLGRRLGHGSYGEVRFCIQLNSEALRAVKIFEREKDSFAKEKLVQEMEIIRKLDHPNIIRVYESFLETDNYYIVMEHLKGGELFREILKEKRFDEPKSAAIMKQILSAIKYLHEQNIIHRDIKPENILFEESLDKMNIKIIDFGSAIFTLKRVRGAIGSAYYVAPEVLTGWYGPACDMWSAGVILYILLCGYPPFEGDSDKEILSKVKQAQYYFEEEDWQHISVEARSLISNLLVPEKNRLTASEALQDPWIMKHAQVQLPTEETFQHVMRKVSDFSPEHTLQGAIRTYIASQMITSKELKHIREVFNMLDTNEDGKLSREELIEGYSKIMGDNTEEFVDKLMALIDVDSNGFIDYTEFVRVAMDNQILLSEQNLKSAFDMFDDDGNGKISAHELRSVLCGNASSHDQIWQKLISEFDTNGDGEIDIEEFKQIILRHI